MTNDPKANELSDEILSIVHLCACQCMETDDLEKVERLEHLTTKELLALIKRKETVAKAEAYLEILDAKIIKPEYHNLAVMKLKEIKSDEPPQFNSLRRDMKDWTKLDKEAQRILLALTSMYFQYCNRPYGHDFMGAGERAIDILEDYGLASEDVGVNEKEYDKLEKVVYE